MFWKFWKRIAMKEKLSEDILSNKEALIVLGNGFTIDFTQHLTDDLDEAITERIDASN